MRFQNKCFEFKTFLQRETQFWDVFVKMLNNSILVTQYGKVTQYHKTNQIEKSNLLIEQRTFDYAVILS